MFATDMFSIFCLHVLVSTSNVHELNHELMHCGGVASNSFKITCGATYTVFGWT